MAFATAEYILCRSSREPALEDLLSDPTIQAVMASDRVNREDLAAMLRRLGVGLSARRIDVRN